MSFKVNPFKQRLSTDIVSTEDLYDNYTFETTSITSFSICSRGDMDREA